MKILGVSLIACLQTVNAATLPVLSVKEVFVTSDGTDTNQDLQKLIMQCHYCGIAKGVDWDSRKTDTYATITGDTTNYNESATGTKFMADAWGFLATGEACITALEGNGSGYAGEADDDQSVGFAASSLVPGFGFCVDMDDTIIQLETNQADAGCTAHVFNHGSEFPTTGIRCFIPHDPVLGECVRARDHAETCNGVSQTDCPNHGTPGDCAWVAPGATAEATARGVIESCMQGLDTNNILADDYNLCDDARLDQFAL